MTRLAPYNKLPPKPEYMKKILGALSDGGELSKKDLQTRSGLTMTQLGCSLEVLLANGTVGRASKKNRMYYFLTR